MPENLRRSSEQPLTSDEVFHRILKRIVNLQLAPGQRISENQMAKEYGVSRSVIRTAFARLQQLKLIAIYPQRATYVSLINLSYIADLLMLRTAVEKEVIYEMFTSLKREDRTALVKALEANLAEQEKCRDEKDYFGKFPKIDSAFHKTMIDSVGRNSLLELLSDDMLHIARWRNFDVAFDHRIPQLIEEHRAIVDAIKAGDMLLCQKRMADHLETISDISSRAIAQFPSYFKQI